MPARARNEGGFEPRAAKKGANESGSFTPF